MFKVLQILCIVLRLYLPIFGLAVQTLDYKHEIVDYCFVQVSRFDYIENQSFEIVVVVGRWARVKEDVQKFDKIGVLVGVESLFDLFED